MRDTVRETERETEIVQYPQAGVHVCVLAGESVWGKESVVACVCVFILFMA